MNEPGSEPRRRTFGPAGWGPRDAAPPQPRMISIGGLAIYSTLATGAALGAWWGLSTHGAAGAVVGLVLGGLFTPIVLGGAAFLTLFYTQLGERFAEQLGLRADVHPAGVAMVRWGTFLLLGSATLGVGFLLYESTPSWMLWMAVGGAACVAVAVLGPLALFLAFVRMRMVQVSAAGRTWTAAGRPSPFGGPRPSPGNDDDGAAERLVIEAEASEPRRLDEPPPSLGRSDPR